ncbi:hypothetical protein EC957_005505 [Mortierella hygrophila]|uniref:Uncharacterized protein n=1 Tax=Mortierella hygrophila TaxID=979708 RepID=A0A9P6FF65_9FUNG|nr:hypothetical protein EC957_005505 [Mortierella hygrophila]
MISASSSFSRAGRRVLTTTSNSRHLCTLLHNTRSTTARIPSITTIKTLTATTTTSSSTARSWYTTTPTLFRKFESHHDHANIHNPSPSSTKSAPVSASASGSQEQEDDGEIPSKDSVNMALLTDADDLMVGNEGLETIDPKDFPELYPHEHEIEGLSQESHPDNERDFEGFQEGEDVEVEVQDMEERRSVLLSDKPRSEDEFSWFVDESYPDKATTGQEEEFIPLWQKNAQRSPDGAIDEQSGAGEPEYTPDSIPGLVKLLESERAKNIKVIDMRDKCDWTNWMVIAEGLSERHLGNVADEVYSALKKTSPSTSPPVMEGRDTSDWVVIDAGSVVIHFMTPEARKERDLEGLWASVKNPLKMKDVDEISWEDVKGKMTKSWKEDHGRSKGEDGKRGRRGERDIPLSDVVKW